jgi:hypothetical protein
MHRSTSRLLLAGMLGAAGATPSASQPVCRPGLAIERSAHFDMVEQQRRWTGVVGVDAARCASPAGAFAIEFIRHKENAPVVAFTEHFTWRPGQTEVTVELWRDEWIEANRILDIAPCRCRE